MLWPIMKSGWVEVSPVWPNERVGLEIRSDLIEKRQILEWTEQLAAENWAEIDHLCRPIVERDPQRISAYDLE